jgi:predicted component of type VI protein secretion system
VIAIRLALQGGGEPATPLIAVFDERGGDIGRAADCTLVLPDPERRISRKHLQVAWRDGRHLLRLVSANLLVELDGAPMVPGAETEVHVGSQVSIGPFVLVVERGAATAPVAPAPPAEAPAQDAFALWAAHGDPGRASVFRDLLSVPPVERRARPREPFDSKLHPLDVVLGGNTDVGAPAPRPQATTDELVNALYRGLGVVASPAARGSPSHMTLVGALLRTAIEGALGLLMARGIARRELGASQTLIQTRQNNPLKFAADADAAMTRLLEPPQRGFIPALEAVGQVFDDLRAHELALLAGMRAALEAMLARFDPGALEESLDDKGVWENILPANHKARLWDRFVEQHALAVREIEGDLDAAFADAFSAAYEEQLRRLRRGGA